MAGALVRQPTLNCFVADCNPGQFGMLARTTQLYWPPGRPAAALLQEVAVAPAAEQTRVPVPEPTKTS